MKKIIAGLFLTISLIFVSGCGNTKTDVDIVASCFPIYDLTKRVVGDKMEVSNLVKAGVEPHEYEPTVNDVKKLTDCKLFIANGIGLEHYTSSFDKKITDKTFICTTGIELIYSEHGHDHDHEHEEEHHEEHEEEHEHHEMFADPHVWLSPINAIKMMENIKNEIIKIDADNKDYYEANFTKNKKMLEDLDAKFRSELVDLKSTTIVTSHEAFGYLCKQYGLTQLAINGLSAKDEPTAAELAEIIEKVKGLNVTTIFSEELVSPAIAQKVADETGLKCAVLNPIEGLATEDQKDDYISLMEKNLTTIKAALK